MTLDEQLAMATSAVPAQPNTAQPAPAMTVDNQNNIQAAAQVVQPTQTVMPQAQTVSAPTQPVNPPIQTMDLNAAQEEAEVNYAVGEINFGQTISTRSIEPFKIDNDEKKRVTLVGKPFWVKIHRHDTLGKLLCWSTDTHLGKCCKDLDTPKVNYCLPVLVYSTMPGDPRTALPQGKSELRLIKIWNQSSWQGIAEELMDKGILVNGQINEQALSNVDFIVTGEGTYGDMKFKATQDSFKQQYAAPLQAAIEKWNTIGIEKSLPTVGRRLDDEKYIKLTQNATPPVMQQYSQEDIFNN